MKFFQSDKSTSARLLWLLGILVFLVVGFGVWYFFLMNGNGISGVTGTELNVSVKKSVNTDFQNRVFQSQKFQELKPHGRLPVLPGTTGVVNPFSGPSAEISGEASAVPQSAGF